MSDDCKSNVLPEPKNVEEIIQRYLLLYGYDGIWNPDVPCGCLSTHLAPCEGDCLGCLPGYRTDYKPEDEFGTCDQYPSLSWLADTNHEAIEGIKRVVADVEADMVAERKGDRRE